MPQDSNSRKLDQYIVRFPDGMRGRLKTASGINKRSMNAEIVARLENSFALPIVIDQLRAELAVARDELENNIGHDLEAWVAIKADLAEKDRMLGQQMAAITDLTAAVQSSQSALATFALMFDEASRGDNRALQDMIERAKRDPLPKTRRRGALSTDAPAGENPPLKPAKGNPK